MRNVLRNVDWPPVLMLLFLALLMSLFVWLIVIGIRFDIKAARMRDICLRNGYSALEYGNEDRWYCTKRSDREDIVVPVEILEQRR